MIPTVGYAGPSHSSPVFGGCAVINCLPPPPTFIWDSYTMVPLFILQMDVVSAPCLTFAVCRHADVYPNRYEPWCDRRHTAEQPGSAPIRRRRTVATAAGRPEDLPAASDGVPDAASSTADMVAIVTREVLKQLREDRDATRAADVTPTAPAPAVDAAPEVVWPMAGPSIERDNPIDFAVAGALSSLMDDKGEPAPNTCVLFHTTALGADLPERIKAKIWANEFVEFFELTHVHHFQPQQMAVSSGDSHQVFSLLPQARGRQISTIAQWTSAFLVFGAIYAQRFPEAAPGLFKYCEVVRDIAATGPPFAWRQYDARFRSLRQFDLAGFPGSNPGGTFLQVFVH